MVSAAAAAAAAVNGATRPSSSMVAPAAAAATVAAAAAAAVPPSDPPTAPSSSSATTMAVTPVPVPAAEAPQAGGPSTAPLLPPPRDPAADGGRGGGTRGGASATTADRRTRHVVGHENGGREANVVAAVQVASEEFGAVGSSGNFLAGGVGDDAENGDTTGGGDGDDGTTNCGSPARGTGEVEEELGLGADPCDANLRNRMGPAFTNEAAGLNELIRRRGGLPALSDARTVASVLRAAAPRRQSALHPQPQQRPARGFFEAEPDDGVPTLSTPPGAGRSSSGGGGGGGDREAAASSRLGSGEEGGDAGEAAGSSTYVSTTCGGFFGTTKSSMVSASTYGTPILRGVEPRARVGRVLSGVYPRLLGFGCRPSASARGTNLTSCADDLR